MTDYAVEFHIPTEHFMSSLTKVSSTTRARHRAWIRRYARGVWRAAIEAGAYGTERFVALAMVQWPGPSIYPAMSCAETLKPIIDAGTDERLWPDDDNSHCRATVFMEAPGLSAYGVTMSNRNAPCCLSIRLMARNVCSPSSHCVRASTRRM